MNYQSDVCITDSDSEIEYMTVIEKGRKNIRTVKGLDELSTSTILSNVNEIERIKRVEIFNKKLENVLQNRNFDDELILDFDFENNVPLVSVHKNLVCKLKNHQKDGVKFMWSACYESLEQIKKSSGSGCILAHCMGLGKTIQVITLIHTLLNCPETKTQTVLICCPKNTVLNWINEFSLWINSDMENICIFNPTKFDDHKDRLDELSTWQNCGGVCILNYELFRLLLEKESKNSNIKPQYKKKFMEYLCDPGPDLIVCDEGHVLKNEETKLSKTICQIKTSRRIILTGTPLQNNLKEYHCMVQFVKPNLLGTRKEFLNMFVNPISNGQYENSLKHDVQLMKERSHILHKKLSGCVQRFDLSVLKQYLPQKREYVIFTPLTDRQIDMYQYYMKNYSAKGDPSWKNTATALFADYQSLQRIWTHPYAFKLHEDRFIELKINGTPKNKKKSKKSVNFYEDDDDDFGDDDYDLNVEFTGLKKKYNGTRYPLNWWTQFNSYDDIKDATRSYKLILFLKLLNEFEKAGEKLLVFSGSLYSLSIIEYFLKEINNSSSEKSSLCDLTSSWELGEDYLILTGQTSAKDRDTFCKRFNNSNNKRLRLFLISTKAGGIGINLTGANRAILFDVSWNPSHDTQSIFRIYRIGQNKPCIVYRFVASGTMEEKIYERQIMKQSISYRVVDELHTARHFKETELARLYKFEPNKKHENNLLDVKDLILQSVLKDSSVVVSGVCEHDSLLEHKEEEELPEIEKTNAWAAYNTGNKVSMLSDEVKELLQDTKRENLNPEYIKRTLKDKFPLKSDNEINELIGKTVPVIETMLLNNNTPNSKKKKFLKLNSESFSTPVRKMKRPYNFLNKENDSKKINLSNYKENIINIDSSDSDDCVVLFETVKRKKRRKPINSWGKRNGKEFGTPEII